MSVGDRRAASIEVGVAVLFPVDAGEAGLEGGDLGEGLVAGFCWLVAEVRLTLGAGIPPMGEAVFSAVGASMVLLLLLLPLDLSSAARELDGVDRAPDAREGLSDLVMFEALRLFKLPRASLATLLPLLEVLVFFPFFPLLPVVLAAALAALPLAASRLLTLSCNRCMISECERSVPVMGTEPRSACEKEERDEPGLRPVALGALDEEPSSSICILATPARVDSAAVSTETLLSELTPGLGWVPRSRSSGASLADEEPTAPRRGEGVIAATDATEEDATDATVSAAGERGAGERN